MTGFNIENLIWVVIVIVLLYVTIKFIKGLLKSIITIILVLTLGLSAYNIFVAQKPVSYEIDRYKTDFAYVKEIKSISSEAKSATEDIKEGKNIKENTEKIVQLRNRAEKTKHSEEIQIVHSNYMKAMDTVVLSAKGYSTAKDAKEQAEKLNDAAKELNISLNDIIK